MTGDERSRGRGGRIVVASVVIGVLLLASTRGGEEVRLAIRGRPGGVEWRLRELDLGSEFGAAVGTAAVPGQSVLRDFVLVGSPEWGRMNGTDGPGRVYLVLEGVVRAVITGQLPGERFGSLVTGVGDVDGDGDGDIAIVSLARGIPQDMPGRDPSPTSQRILIHSNTHWHPKWEPLAGSVVAWIGDINGDGNADILASDPLAGTEGAQEGIVRVYSGADGSVLTEVRGDVPGGQWGHGLASIQDLDGDGSRDIVAGGPRMPEEVRPGDASRQEVGHVRIVGSVTGSQIARIDGGAMGGWFGYEVATGGDFDGDGMEDFVVSESQRFLDEDPEGGEVTVFSGATREPLLRVRSGHGCSWATSVAVLGDATGDGVPDLAVGDTNGFGHGAALFSGRDGQLLTPIQAEEDVFAGVFSVARVGDVNGDGKADVLVGRTVGMTTVANEVFVQRL